MNTVPAEKQGLGPSSRAVRAGTRRPGLPATPLASQPAWMQARAQMLHTVCSFIAARVKAGESIAKASEKAARKFRGRPLGSERFFRASSHTIYRAFFKWRKNPSPETLCYRFAQPRPKIDRALVKQALDFCIERGLSVKAAYRALTAKSRRKPCVYESLCRLLPAAELRRLRALDRELLTAAEAAILLGVPLEQVFDWLIEGQLEGRDFRTQESVRVFRASAESKLRRMKPARKPRQEARK